MSHFIHIFCFFFLSTFLDCSTLICTGGCINSSPAGKRRIANGAEQQQLSSVADDALMGNGKDSTGLLSHFGSAFTTITSIAVAACLLVVTIFVIIFAILQVRHANCIFNHHHRLIIFRYSILSVPFINVNQHTLCSYQIFIFQFFFCSYLFCARKHRKTHTVNYMPTFATTNYRIARRRDARKKSQYPLTTPMTWNRWWCRGHTATTTTTTTAMMAKTKRPIPNTYDSTPRHEYTKNVSGTLVKSVICIKTVMILSSEPRNEFESIDAEIVIIIN